MTPELFQQYKDRGFALCRIPAGKKNPIDPAWPLNPIIRPEDFRPDDSVGLICGPLSGRLMGADLDFHSDDSEAWAAADEILAETGLIDGRPGKLRAHRLYRCLDTCWPDSVLPKVGSITRAAMDAGSLPRFAGTRHFTNGAGRAIDLIGAGGQIVIPPSFHAASNTHRQWFRGEPGEASETSYSDLLAAIQLIAERLGMKIPKDIRDEDAPLPPDSAELAKIPVSDRVARLKAYLAQATALAHGQGQGFHAQQWRIACVCAELGVPFENALPLYQQWNKTSPTPDGDSVNHDTLMNAYRSAVFSARIVTNESPVDLSAITSPVSIEIKAAGESEEAEPSTNDPGPVPEQLLKIPGFVGDVMNFSLSTAPYPNPVMAFCGAVALQGTLAGRKVRDEADNRTNLYLLGLANSGAGKDHPRKVNQRIMLECDLANQIGDTFASAEGIEDRMLLTPTMLFQTDEMDALLISIREGKDGRSERIMQSLLKFYTSANALYPMRVKAGSQPELINQPCLSIFGTAIPQHFYESLSAKMLSNGFFARMLVLEAGRRGGGQKATTPPIPPSILSTARWWGSFRPRHQSAMSNIHPSPIIVPTQAEAQAILEDIRHQSERSYDEHESKGDQMGMAIWARAVEKVHRLALIFGCSCNHESPFITPEAVEWAWRLVEHQTRRMIAMAQFHVYEGDFDQKQKKAIQAIRSKGGSISQEQMTKVLRSLPTRERDEIITNLIQTGQVEVVTEQTTGRPKTSYRLTLLSGKSKEGGKVP